MAFSFSPALQPPTSGMEIPTVDICSTKQCFVGKVNFTWVIPNVSFFLPNFQFKSESFPEDSESRIKWHLNLSVSNKDSQFIFDISLQLNEYSHRKDVPCKFILTILRPRHEQKDVNNVKECNLYRFININSRSPVKTTKVDDLQDILEDDKLTIVCKMHFTYDVVGGYDTKLLPSIECDMADNFSHLLRSKMLSDVKLVVGEQVFPAHKIVLAARSEVFAAMFEHKMEEAVSGQVSLNDVTPEVLKEMLTFIYTGKSPNMEKMADELLVLADKYALKKLHAMAEISLYRKLSKETAFETLILASRHNGMFLKKETIKYMKRNAKVLIKTKGWAKILMSEPDLLPELFEAL